MKKEKILNLIGIVLGIAIIIAGISIMKNPAETWSTSSVDSCRFGADFYTEQYAATRAAAHNAATTARNIDSLGEKIAQYEEVRILRLRDTKDSGSSDPNE